MGYKCHVSYDIHQKKAPNIKNKEIESNLPVMSKIPSIVPPILLLNLF